MLGKKTHRWNGPEAECYGINLSFIQPHSQCENSICSDTKLNVQQEEKLDPAEYKGINVQNVQPQRYSDAVVTTEA